MYSCPLPSFSGRSRASASGTKSPLRKGRECGWVAWFPWGLPGRGPRAAHCRRGCRDRAFPYSGDISKREAWCASNSSSTLRRFGCQSASMEPLLVRRPATSCVATSRGNVMLFCGLGNHVDLRGLRGGAEGNRTDGHRGLAASNRGIFLLNFTGSPRHLRVPADRLIVEFFGLARLVSGPGLAVVTATAAPNPRG